MKAVTWHGKRDVRVDTVPDPKVEEPTDAIIEVTSTNICGSDLHLYEMLGAFMNAGDILGHEPMGIVREVGPGVTNLTVGDRVVIPFQISCGSCYMCDQQLFTQCETTQVRDQGMGAALFGYSELYGAGARRPGRAASRTASPVHPHQGSRRATGLTVRLSLRRPADGVAGGRLRRHSRRGLGDGAGTRTDRRHGGSHRSPPGLSGHRRRQGAGADRAGRRPAACTRSISTNTTTISATSSAT